MTYTQETIATLDVQIADARKAVEKAEAEKYFASCSDDFLYTSGRIHAYNDDIRAAEKRLKDLIETRDAIKSKMDEFAYFD
jgi:hypothetical protein